MPSLKTIRNRITSVKNTRKITRAMKLVAAAKLRRAQDAIIAARPYTAAITKVVSELAVAAKGARSDDPAISKRLDEIRRLYEQKPDPKTAAIVVITSDRGLAGAFSTNVIKAVERAVSGELSSATEVSLRIIGKKANQHFSRRNASIASYDPAPAGATALDIARATALRIVDDFISGRVDRVLVAFNEFKNAGTQVVRVDQLLPVVPEKAVAPASDDTTYEPSREALLVRLTPLYIEVVLYRALLESIAAFFGAQMMAMENATKNAADMIKRYTLQYNRARQAAITKELLEIIGGAEALKG
jgi:F-type H+-transporting ATPase subunit gamma